MSADRPKKKAGRPGKSSKASRSTRSKGRARRPLRGLSLEVTSVPQALIDLDPQNPRLPEGFHGRSQDELLAQIAEKYNAIEIGESISAHGYFLSEPLIVIRSGTRYVAVEGNRRLVALRLLADPSLAASLHLADAEKWKELARGALLPPEIPVVIAGSRRDVAPIIGYRHISGIEPWEPYAKARFLADLVDNQNLAFEDVANQVGEDAIDVQAHYRNFRAVKQAERQLRLPTEAIKNRFGVFTRTLQDSRVLDYLAIPRPENVRRGQNPLSPAHAERFKEFSSWVFGNGGDPVLTDSRQIRQLGRVLASDEGVQVLRRTRNLDEAFLASGGLRQRLLSRLAKAEGGLAAARVDIEAFADDDEVKDRLNRCSELLVELRQAARL
jgi:hypothetical protein